MTETDFVFIKRTDLIEMIRSVVKEVVDELRNDLPSNEIRKNYYTVKELCAMWSVSITTLWRHEKLGHLHPKRVGRHVLYPKEEIDAMGSLRPTKRNTHANGK